MIMWMDSVTLTQYLSLNFVQVGALQATWRENGIAVIVSLDAQNHVAAVQVQQIVREGADRAYH